MNQEKYNYLKEYLVENCQGLENAKTSQRISFDTSIPDRQLRNAILDLYNDGILLVSSSSDRAGYYIAKNWVEYGYGTKHIRSRAMKELYRLKVSDLLASKKFGNQLNLEGIV